MTPPLRPSPRAAEAPRRWRARVVALVLGGLLFGSVPRSTASVWQPDRGFTPEVFAPDQAAGSTTRSFGVPFRVVTITRGPSSDDVGVAVQPLALLGDAMLGGFVLAVLLQWWRRRRERAAG